jgi:hypothetical protein
VPFVDPWRRSPLLWTVGVIVFTPLIVAGGLFVVAMALTGGLWRVARQTLVSAQPGVALTLSPGIAPLFPLRPTSADGSETAAVLSRAA